MNLNHTELYEVDWRPTLEKFSHFDPTPNEHKEEKKEDKPRKLFKPKGTGLNFYFFQI